MDVKDAVVVAKGVLDKKVCEDILKRKEEWYWFSGNWYQYGKKGSDGKMDNTFRDANYTKTLADEDFQKILQETLIKSTRIYDEHVPLFRMGIDLATEIKIHRYEVGNCIERHRDHIHSIFDGEKKGIPVLSFVGLLSDDFEGGEFIMFDDYKVDLEAGDIVMFPSCFLYPHQVTTVTKGTRYSFVAWGF